jgi:glycosyltransferase involved in cell wall biosynthesis
MENPFISILTPVFNPPLEAFNHCIKSVLSQSFSNWEWCIVDDAGPNSHLTATLASLAESDPRVKLHIRPSNGGIVSASNDAANMATAEFICLLDHDDELHPDALQRIFEKTLEVPTVDYLYTDEDKIDRNGNHYDAFLKPDWSPERLRGQNYCCHLSVIRNSLFKKVGGFRDGFEGSQDYDLILRITEVARSIVHIPEILYHWRSIEGSTAASIDEKPYAFTAAKRAVSEHLSRVGIDGVVLDAGFGFHRVVRSLPTHPLVSIVIPTRGDSKIIFGELVSLPLLAIRSILQKSTYNNLEIILVADTETPDEVLNSISELGQSRVKIVPYDKKFNFSDKCNIGVLASRGDVVLLLNDDTSIISDDWIETMLGHALEPDVGLVGPMLLLEDSRIQSACHSNTLSPHNFRNGYSSNEPGEFGVLAIARECSGVTGAAMMLRRDVYIEAGGMSLTFPNCFNDVDFAFKLLDLGYRIIWTPHARLYHFESATRDSAVTPPEYDLLLSRWGRKFDNDNFCRLN